MLSCLNAKLDQLFDIFGNLFCIEVAAVPLERGTVLIDKEFFEIPCNIGSAYWGPCRNGGAVEVATWKNQSIVIVAAVSLGITWRILWVGKGFLQDLEQWI